MAIVDTRGAAPQRARVTYRILDPKFRLHTRHYLLQCLAATIAIFAVLSVLDAVAQTVLVAALGASAFIAFTMPGVNASRPRYLLGGYIAAIVVGCSVSMMSTPLIALAPVALKGSLPIAFAALAMGLSLFIMVITDTEHPPAAGLALGFVLNEWDLLTALLVFAGVAAISAIKEAFKARMMDLL